MCVNGTQIGTRVRIQINHKGDAFEALGRVVNVRPLMGAGIAFTKIEDKHQAILEKWIEGLRDQERNGNGL